MPPFPVTVPPPPCDNIPTRHLAACPPFMQTAAAPLARSSCFTSSFEALSHRTYQSICVGALCRIATHTVRSPSPTPRTGSEWLTRTHTAEQRPVTDCCLPHLLTNRNCHELLRRPPCPARAPRWCGAKVSNSLVREASQCILRATSEAYTASTICASQEINTPIAGKFCHRRFRPRMNEE